MRLDYALEMIGSIECFLNVIKASQVVSFQQDSVRYLAMFDLNLIKRPSIHILNDLATHNRRCPWPIQITHMCTCFELSAYESGWP